MLAAARNDAGLNQRELAKLVNRPQSYIGKSETGERRIDLIEFLKIVDALGVSPGEFIKKLQKRLRTSRRTS